MLGRTAPSPNLRDRRSAKHLNPRATQDCYPYRRHRNAKPERDAWHAHRKFSTRGRTEPHVGLPHEVVVILEPRMSGPPEKHGGEPHEKNRYVDDCEHVEDSESTEDPINGERGHVQAEHVQDVEHANRAVYVCTLRQAEDTKTQNQ